MNSGLLGGNQECFICALHTHTPLDLISLAATAVGGISFRTYGSIPSVLDVVVVRVFALPLVSGGSNHGSRGFEVFSVWKFKKYIRFTSGIR